MLIPVTEHHVAQEQPARLGQNFASASDQAPGFLHAGVVKLWEQASHGGDAFVEFVEDFLPACGLREVGEVGSLGRIVLDELENATGHKGQMVSELSSRHGFFVRLPSQLVFRQTLQKFARDWRLYFELREQGLCDRHADSPFRWETETLLNGGGFG